MKDRINMGGLDRLGRFIAGIALVAVGLIATFTGGWKLAAVAVGAFVLGGVLLATAATGFCPGYLPFRIDTRPRSFGT